MNTIVKNMNTFFSFINPIVYMMKAFGSCFDIVPDRMIKKPSCHGTTFRKHY